jgi:hypothetical protein
VYRHGRIIEILRKATVLSTPARSFQEGIDEKDSSEFVLEIFSIPCPHFSVGKLKSPIVKNRELDIKI